MVGVGLGVMVVWLVSWTGVGVQGHGRLIEPPGRSSAWRYGFSTPHNYNDHEIYCGGFSTQWQKNGGKCGPCGDPWHLPQPRPNEGGGTYGRGVIVKTYKHSSVVVLGVELTANHRGFFEFRICPHNQPNKPVSNKCLDENVLQKADGTGPRYFPGAGAKKFYVKYRLPREMTCKQCVLQWRYVAGNNWGKCENGTGMVGCGPQEQFRACADIMITEEDGSADDTPRIPDYDEDYNEEDYNEIDVDTRKDPKLDKEDVSHIGHIVALTFSFLLIIVVIFGLLAYFYWAKDAFKGLLKHKNNPWAKKTPVPSSLSEKPKSIISISGPIGAPPPVPPRRHRKVSGGDPALAPDPNEIRSISQPTRVTINGVAVNSGNGVNGISPIPLHVPDD